MSNEQKGGGVPANINPFCIDPSCDISDGAFHSIAPQYFVEKDGRYTCPTKLESPALSQEEAEEMVRRLVAENRVDSLGIKMDLFFEIVPNDLPDEVFIVTEGCWDPETGEFEKEHGVTGFYW